MSDRAYQTEAVTRTAAAVAAGRRRILLTMPTGAGKGHIAASLVARAVAKGKRVLFLAHRRELVLDLAERVQRHGIRAGVILPGIPPRDEPAQVASIQTLSRRDLPAADLVIADECHHATSATWRRVLDAYASAVVVGFTATPCRLGGAPLGDLFEELIQVTTPAELVAAGFLVPVRGWAFSPPSLAGIPRTGGDFDTSALALAMGSSKVLGNVVSEYQHRAAGSRAIVFAVNVEHSQALALTFKAAGVAAEHIDGTASRLERDDAVARFRSGATRVLCSVSLFTEGFDLPAIETVILARPTASLGLALQMIGRGRRPLPCACGGIPHHSAGACLCGAPVTKRFCRIHDHGSVVMTHGHPDEPRIWSLDKPTRTTARQLAKGIGSVRTCAKCFALYASDLEVCPACGVRNQAQKRLVRTAQGVAVPLEHVQRRVIAPGPFLAWLKKEQQAHDYKPAWVAVRFKARFGRWPTKQDWHR